MAAWARDHGHALILLGRRVAGSFGLSLEAPYGEGGFLTTGAPYLFLPHPSARTRWLYHRTKRSQLETWVRTFWALYGQEMIE